MVGVPGRSKACHTCRQRRIKCDGGRPGCRNCAKTGRLCGGYHRVLAFVLSKEMRLLDEGSSKTPRHLIEKSDSGPVLVSRWRVSQEPTRSSEQDKRGLPVAAPDGLPVPPLLPSLIYDVSPRNAFRDQLLSFFRQTLIQSNMISRNHLAARNKAVFSQILGNPNLSLALEYAMLAVCSACLGKVDSNQQLSYGSLALYARSLYALRRAIVNPATRCQDQTLATCMVLMMYEFTECPGQAIYGYLAHVNGAMRLHRLRGPGAHARGIGHTILYRLRSIGVFDSIGKRQPGFLAQDEWRQLPYAICKKSIDDEILDILLELPTVISQYDALVKEISLPRIIARALQIGRLCWQIDRKLDDWFARFEADVDGPLYWPELSTMDSATDSPVLGKLFPVAFWFSSLVVAQTLNMYWMAQMILFCHFCKIHTKLKNVATSIAERIEAPSCTCIDHVDGVHIDGADDAITCLRHFTPDKLPPLSRRESPKAPARKICQTAEYLLNDELGYLAASTLIGPLLYALIYFKEFDEDCTREQVWVTETLCKLEDKGFRLPQHVLPDLGLS